MSDTTNATLEPFAWHNLHPSQPCPVPANKVASFAGRTADVLSGIQTVMRLIESDLLAQETVDAPPAIQRADLGSLHRLIIVTTEMLAAEAERMVDAVTEHRSWEEQGQSAPGPALRPVPAQH